MSDQKKEKAVELTQFEEKDDKFKNSTIIEETRPQQSQQELLSEEKKLNCTSSNFSVGSQFCIISHQWTKGYVLAELEPETVQQSWNNASIWYSSVLYEKPADGDWKVLESKGTASKKIIANAKDYLPSDSNRRTITMTNSVKEEDEAVYASNLVVRSKYTPVTFFPLNLFEQIKRPANAYFIFIGILQCVPEISISDAFPTILLPLLFVFSVSMLKDGIEDMERHRADNEENNREFSIYDHSKKDFITKISKDICVGDIVQVNDEEFFPADLLVIASKLDENWDTGAYCYVETSNLDGETNLKIKTIPDVLLPLTGDQVLNCMNAEIKCDIPNGNIDEWNGRITVTGKDDNKAAAVLGPDNLLLRGSKLKNSTACYGLVIYSGNQTKIEQNSKGRKNKIKRSSVEKQMNGLILFMGLLQAFVCLVTAISFVVWQYANQGHTYYLQLSSDIGTTGFFRFCTWLIILSSFVPISLIVSMETVKFLQGTFIGWDIDMMHHIDVQDFRKKLKRAETSKGGLLADTANNPFARDEFASAQTTSLNEELGMVKYILSDKTGTLTCNRMDFRKCIIGCRQYGTGETAISLAAKQRRSFIGSRDEEKRRPSEPAEDTVVLPHVKFNGRESLLKSLLVSGSKDQKNIMKDYFRCLTLCNTVFPTKEKDGNVILKASSPDEKCLVEFASFIGFKLMARNPKVSLEIPGAKRESTNFERLNSAVKYSNCYTPTTEEHEVLAVLDFTSKRKRMTVVIRDPSGKIMVYTKGADNIIRSLLKGYETNELKKYHPHLEFTMHKLLEFGDQGLRTLLVAVSERDASWWDDPVNGWGKRLMEGTPETEGPDEKNHFKGGCKDSCRICRIETTLEKEAELLLIGATAIEDKLQDEVPETIEFFLKSGIHVWVLTGDKLETAINIGMACNLIESSMERKGNLFRLVSTTKESLNEEISHHVTRLAQDEKNGKDGPYCLVMTSGAVHVLFTSLPKKDESFDTANLSALVKKFLNVAKKCKSVVGCRLTPAQKAFIVKLVKKTQGKITMAVGDGANDEPMIREAHIGIGIRGVEGTTAVRASDYAISQFRFLRKLIFVHGRHNYRRVSMLICYIFYKNSMLSFTSLWFACFSGFSGQMYLLEWAYQLWNMMYSAFPIFVYAIFERDIPKEELMTHPEIYTKTQNGELFNRKVFRKWIMYSILHSAIIFFFSIWAFLDPAFDGTGQSSGLWVTGVVIYTSCTWVVNLKLAMHMESLTWMHNAILIGTIVMFYFTMLVFNATNNFRRAGADYYYVVNRLFTAPKYWFTIFITIVMTLLVDFIFMIFDKLQIGKTTQTIEVVDSSGSMYTNVEETVPESPPIGKASSASMPRYTTSNPDDTKSNTGFAFDYTPGDAKRLQRRTSTVVMPAIYEEKKVTTFK